MSTELSYIQNANGRFHVGMTLREAQIKGVDKCTFRRDFYNLDKNSDGILSISEIMNERKRDARIEKWTAIGFGAWGLMDLFTKSHSLLSFWTLVDAFIVGSSIHNYRNIKKQDKMYEELIAQHAAKRLNVKA